MIELKWYSYKQNTLNVATHEALIIKQLNVTPVGQKWFSDSAHIWHKMNCKQSYFVSVFRFDMPPQVSWIYDASCDGVHLSRRRVINTPLHTLLVDAALFIWALGTTAFRRQYLTLPKTRLVDSLCWTAIELRREMLSFTICPRYGPFRAIINPMRYS